MPRSVAHGSQFKQCKQRVKQQIVDNCGFKRAGRSALHVKSRGHMQSSIDYHDFLICPTCIYYPSNHELQSNAKSLPREVLKHTCCTWTFGGHTWVRLWSRCLPELFSVGDPILNLYCACRCTAGLVSRGLTWALGWLVFWGLGCEEIDGFHSSQ